MHVNLLSSKLSQQNNTWRKYCNRLLCWLWTCIFQLVGFYIVLWRLERQLKTFALKIFFFFQFFNIKWMKIMCQHFFANVYGKLQWSCQQSRWQLPSADVNFMGWVFIKHFIVFLMLLSVSIETCKSLSDWALYRQSV